MNIDVRITRVWQYPDKPDHLTVAVSTPAKQRQFDVAIETPLGRYLRGMMRSCADPT